jgi:hypothetical protein
MTTKKAASVKIKTGEVRASYVHLFEPKLNELSGKHEYGAMLLIDKDDKKTVNAIKNGIKNICKESFGTDDLAEIGCKHPLRDPAKDPKKENNPIYKNKFYINTKNLSRPGIAQKVDGKVVRLEHPDEFKSGDYCLASLVIKTFDVKVKKGISVYCQNFLKTKEGDSLAGVTSPEDDFAEELKSSKDEADFMD